MKRTALCLLLAIMTAAGVSAQDTTRFKAPGKPAATTTTSAQNSWIVEVGAGTQMYFGKNDSNMSFGDRLGQSFSLSIGRTIDEILSWDVCLTEAGFNGLYYPSKSGQYFTTEDVYADGKNPGYALYVQSGNYINVSARLHANLLRLFCGYDPDRKYEAQAFLGAGYAFGIGSEGKGAKSPTINGGLSCAYDIDGRNGVKLNLFGALLDVDFDGEPCSEHKMHGYAGLSFSYTYSF